MSLTRSFTRASVVAVASAALMVGAAGAASAASVKHEVDGNTVSATFSAGFTSPVDGCVAVVAERGEADSIRDRIANMVDLDNIGETFRGERTTILRTANGSAVAVPFPFSSSTLSADDVPTGVHSLITYCATDNVPVINTIAVGDAENTMGSVVTQGPAVISSGLNFL